MWEEPYVPRGTEILLKGAVADYQKRWVRAYEN